MNRFENNPVTFIQYPYGAGGWFIGSLLYIAKYPRSTTAQTMLIDGNGSAHKNIELIEAESNFYKEFMHTKEAHDIFWLENFENFNIEQRRHIIFNNLRGETKHHFLPCHPQDINVFLDAIPQSNCIQINVDPEDVRTCIGNFLYKDVGQNVIDLAKDLEQDPDEAKTNLENILESKEALDYFSWVEQLITRSCSKEEINSHNQNKVLKINFKDIRYLDIDVLLEKLLSFVNINPKKDVYSKLYDFVKTYRRSQPVFK